MKRYYFVLLIFSICFPLKIFAADRVVVVPLGKNDPNLLPENICTGVTISGVSGAKICIPTVTSAGGRVWMDRNLGASRAAISMTDRSAYGDLYQWGRLTDGHEQRNSPTTSVMSTGDVPVDDNFILTTTPPYDWRTPQNDELWQGLSGTNNPCPLGFRIPTQDEWLAEINSWTSKDTTGAFASPLKLPAAGYRLRNDGSLYGVGTEVVYWASDFVVGAGAQSLYIHSSSAVTGQAGRADGYSVRCIKD